MRRVSYNIKKDLVKTHFSLAKFFFITGGIVLLSCALLFIYFNYIHSESLEFYKEIEGCRVKTEFTVTRKRSFFTHGDSWKTKYYVYVYTPEGEKNIGMVVSESYYKKMLGFDRAEIGVPLSVFKTSDGSLFPAYTKDCSVREAERQYAECYPPKGLNFFLKIAAWVGGACFGVGMLALRSAKRRDRELADEVAQTGVEESQEVKLLQEFNEAIERDPLRRTRYLEDKSGKSGESQKRLTAGERDELLKEFDKLTTDGKYKYKMHE